MNKKVMIIEDCAAINFLISTILEKEFIITSVKNCSDAMHQLQRDVNSDLIILDIPDSASDNFELLEHISTSCVLKDIRRVVISDSNDEQLKTKTAELGVSLFLTKPFDPVYLSDKVREFVDQKTGAHFMKKSSWLSNLNIF